MDNKVVSRVIFRLFRSRNKDPVQREVTAWMLAAPHPFDLRLADGAELAIRDTSSRVLNRRVWTLMRASATNRKNE